MNETHPELKAEKKNRLGSLDVSNRPQRGGSLLYSRLIRFLRLILPAFALVIVAMLFVFPEMQKKTEPVARQEVLPDVPFTQNELLKPRYESLDKDGQPFTVTADEATQDQNNPELIVLSKPTADITLKDGAWIAGKAEQGIYEQNAEKLQLKGNVNIFHDAGYTLITEELRINLKTQDAFSDTDVQAQGPEGTITAIGLEARGEDNLVLFKGPAKMTLISGENGLNLGSAMP